MHPTLSTLIYWLYTVTTLPSTFHKMKTFAHRNLSLLSLQDPTPLPRRHQMVPRRPNPLPFAEGAQEFHWTLASLVSWQCAHAKSRFHSQMASCLSPGDWKWQGYMWYRSKNPKAKGQILKETQHWPALTQLKLLFKESTFHPKKTTRKRQQGACLAWNSRKLLCDHGRSQSTGWPGGVGSDSRCLSLRIIEDDQSEICKCCMWFHALGTPWDLEFKYFSSCKYTCTTCAYYVIMYVYLCIVLNEHDPAKSRGATQPVNASSVSVQYRYWRLELLWKSWISIYSHSLRLVVDSCLLLPPQNECIKSLRLPKQIIIENTPVVINLAWPEIGSSHVLPWAPRLRRRPFSHTGKSDWYNVRDQLDVLWSECFAMLYGEESRLQTILAEYSTIWIHLFAALIKKIILKHCTMNNLELQD